MGDSTLIRDISRELHTLIRREQALSARQRTHGAMIDILNARVGRHGKQLAGMANAAAVLQMAGSERPPRQPVSHARPKPRRDRHGLRAVPGCAGVAVAAAWAWAPGRRAAISSVLAASVAGGGVAMAPETALPAPAAAAPHRHVPGERAPFTVPLAAPTYGTRRPVTPMARPPGTSPATAPAALPPSPSVLPSPSVPVSPSPVPWPPIPTHTPRGGGQPAPEPVTGEVSGTSLTSSVLNPGPLLVGSTMIWNVAATRDLRTSSGSASHLSRVIPAWDASSRDLASPAAMSRSWASRASMPDRRLSSSGSSPPV